MKSDTVLFIDKPTGTTSFSVIRQLRKVLDTRKIGHGGTLDPMATGLLIVGVGSGTKQLTEVIGSDKTYEARIQFGTKTTTGDLDGDYVKGNSDVYVSKEKLKKVLKEMIGSMILEVSPYSAIKQGGEPVYKKVLRGDVYITPKREMVIYEAEMILFDEKEQFTDVVFKVASGTYVRSLGEELAKRLGTFGHLTKLRRISIGDWHVSEAHPVDYFKKEE